MYLKIAMKNIRNSFKDYAIYFITLTLAVCIFYNFNSMNSQAVMYGIQNIGPLIKVISYLSVFMSIIFAGLIIYANKSLIKKRKKEFGIYATLGMSKNKIYQILIFETFIVGVISLIIGLLVGIVLSQGISVITGKLFEYDMTEYKFIISTSSINKTFIYFGIMFIIVMIFNTIVVSRHKLIDMINALKKNEDIKVKNPMISFIVFIISLIVLGKAYYLGLEFGCDPKASEPFTPILLGSIGTVLFFFGLYGFLLLLLRKNEQIYLKKLNIFVIKQFTSKINTSFISMSIICLMLFSTIGILTSSLSINSDLEKKFKKVMPFDATIELDVFNDEQKTKDIKKALEKIEFELDGYNYGFLDFYNIDTGISSLLNENSKEYLKEYYGKLDFGYLDVIKISQYNEMRKLKGEPTINLKENEALLITDKDIFKELLKSIKNQKQINIDNKSYVVKNDIDEKEGCSNVYEGSLIAVIHDEDVKDMTKYSSTVNINLKEKNKEESEYKIKELKKEFEGTEYEEKKDELLNEYGTIVSVEIKDEYYNQIKNTIGMVLYMGLYIGFVFLISSAAVLAIQQLTEASDSLSRYKSLKKIGASDDMINKTIFTQILIHFMLPLSVAMVHFLVLIAIVNRLTTSSGILLRATIGPTLGALGCIIIIYGGYFYATYLSYKKIVKNN
ncbi:ABC transporter permease [Tepidibacter sp. Z1-5]|uniref:ABC transporter permease n=1 Tax=Tepidibacter sp. Z1-5 TaxID=3134138 RepID=UPI0030BB2E08